MSFPLHLPDQLTPHLRALRKSRGLTQAQLGALVGVKQARIAEIEAHPGAVSLDQLTKVLAALRGTLHLHIADVPAPQPLPASEKTSSQKKTRNLPPASVDHVVGDSTAKRRIAKTAKSAPSTLVVIRAKKGEW